MIRSQHPLRIVIQPLKRSWNGRAPTAEKIGEFETNIGVCLSEAVTPYEERIDEILGGAPAELRQEASILASTIQRDESLDYQQRGHLYRELISAVLESGTGDSAQKSAE
jgi:hypothetical protein